MNSKQMAASHQGKSVFFCHAGENKTFVRQLVDRLEKDGLKKDQIFYDEISLQPGDELDSINKVIENPSLKLFIFVVSKYCFQSNKRWVRAEWEAALENNKQIFPIWLDDNNDGFKAFGNLVGEFSYKLKKRVAEIVNLQEVSTSLPAISEKICSLVCGDHPAVEDPSPSADNALLAPRQTIWPAIETATWPEGASHHSIDCTICCDALKNPKVLPCSHTFCRECLREWVAESVGDDTFHDTFPCPKCRQPVPIPEHGVNALKDNIYLANLAKAVEERQRVRHGKDDLLCTSCEEGKPATSRCSDCAKFLCESCESTHRNLRGTKGHTLFTFEELKAGTYDDVFRARKAPPCSKHPGEIVKLYCRTCETPICNECALFEHRDSRHDYTRIEEVALEKREATLDLTSQCQARMEFFHQAEEALERLKEQLQLNAEGARQNVQSLLAQVKEECERLLTCIDAEEKVKKKQIDAEIEGAQISLASAKSTCEFAETLARERGDYEVVSFSQDVTKRLNDFTKSPANKVDVELGNITVDYSTLNQTLAKNSPQYVQASGPSRGEMTRSLCCVS